jgi:hypothetical protein
MFAFSAHNTALVKKLNVQKRFARRIYDETGTFMLPDIEPNLAVAAHSRTSRSGRQYSAR